MRLIDFVYHSTLGLRVIQKEKKGGHRGAVAGVRAFQVASLLIFFITPKPRVE